VLTVVFNLKRTNLLSYDQEVVTDLCGSLHQAGWNFQIYPTCFIQKNPSQ